jgi:hypothetical protein
MAIAGVAGRSCPGGGDGLEAVEEEPPAGHQLHGDDPGRRLAGRAPGQKDGGIGAHVAHRRDALSQQVAQVGPQVFRRAAVHHEQQVDVASRSVRE